MPTDDYKNAVGGGLKLKGARVDKKTKKKRKANAIDPAVPSKMESADAVPDETVGREVQRKDDVENDSKDAATEEEAKSDQSGKTEAQRRFEERRRQRLEERLEREGVQTHKERVQQLNKYLSTLSEHNDMPRIGPG